MLRQIYGHDCFLRKSMAGVGSGYSSGYSRQAHQHICHAPKYLTNIYFFRKVYDERK